MNHAIAARGLRRTYGRGDDAYEAVRGIDLDVEEGEVFALLGTNGAGKTSTLDLLEGLAVVLIAIFLPVATGQLNLGGAGFQALGAYAAAFLSSKYALPLPVTIGAGALLGTRVRDCDCALKIFRWQ